jgi:cyclopropane fatty-acyl-phospholipid synthase-like methyltransferase
LHGTGKRPENSAAGTLYNKDFWRKENLNYTKPHLRMEKIGKLVNGLAQGKERTLLDVGCGPAALQGLLAANVQYYGVDIAIQEPAPNLIEVDLIEAPIAFGDRKFDIVVAQGFFEYVAKHQSQKFLEIADVLAPGGTFVASYVNFDHRQREVYWPYSNVQPHKEFRAALAQHFHIRKCYPTSYNWHHWEPSQSLVRAINMRINATIPVVASVLGVQYLFICSAR